MSTVMSEISKLWYSSSEHDWNQALERYWDYVRPDNLELERQMNELKLEQIAGLDSLGWYWFLHHQYFRWKYTAPNRYATTTMSLKRYFESDRLEELFRIKNNLLWLDVSDIRDALIVAKKIKGLGIASASGLLSLMYPQTFGTVDQFVVKALQEIADLPEKDILSGMNKNNLTLQNGVVLIKIIRRKAEENCQIFGNSFWNPRKIDMVLWATRKKGV